MLGVFRVARPPLPPLSPPSSNAVSVAAAGRKTATTRYFSKARPTAQGPMETTNQEDRAAESQPESFGIAYSTRCEEEGFGGTYAGHPPRVSHRESPAASEPPPSDEEMKKRESQKEHDEGEKAAASRPT